MSAYKVFVSYSHSADDRFAPVLQSALHRFARPWNQLRAMRVFLDSRSLSATPKLWSTIQAALQESEYLLLLASPGSAKSEWVPREVQHWLGLGRADKLLVALTDGEIVWDGERQDFHWEATTALPRTLAGVLQEPPLFVDFRWAKQEEHLSLDHPRFRDKIADLSSTLQGIPKDALIGEDVRQHEKSVRLRRVAITALAALCAALGVAVAISVQQRNEAVRQTNIATARQLAAEAEVSRNRDPRLLPVSALLAVESLRRFPTTEADQTLRFGLALLPRPVSQVVHKPALDGTNNAVAAAFTRDGARLVTLSNNLARVWDAATGKEVATLTHESFVRRFAISPDGQYLATTSFDGLRVWDDWGTPAARDVARLEHGTGVLDAEFSPGGRFLATAGDDGVARVWSDWRSSNPVMVSSTPSSGTVMLVAFTADDTRLVTVDEEATIAVWNAMTGEKEPIADRKGTLTRDRRHLLVMDGVTLRVLELPDGPELASVGNLDVDTDVSNVNAFDLAIDGGYSALASDNVVAIRSLRDGRQVATLRHEARVEEVLFQPGGRRLATRSVRGAVRLWDVESAGEVARLVPDESPDVLAFSPNGQYLATAGSLTANVWTTTASSEIARLEGEPHAAAFAPDGRFVATGGLDSQVRIFTFPEGLLLAAPPQLPSVINAIAVSPSGRYLAAAGHFVADVWKDWTQAPARVARMEHKNVVRAVAFSHDERYLATSGSDKAVVVWEGWQSSTPRPVARLVHKEDIHAVVFSRDSRYLVTASYDGYARVWRGWSGESAVEIARLRHEDTQGGWRSMQAVAFSLDGRYLATSTWEQTRVWTGWDTPAPRQVARFASSRISPGAGFSPDGRYLATIDSGTNDSRDARVWDLESGREVARITKSAGADVRLTGFSPDGRYLLTDGAVSFWRPDDLIREACTRLVLGVGRDEWRRFRGADGAAPGPCDAPQQ